MAQIKKNLALADLVLLKLIRQYPNLHKSELWQVHGGLWNMSLKPLVESGHCAYVTADRRFASAIDTLRFCGLLQEEYPYVATEAAEVMFLSLPKSERRWPLVIPLMEDGTRDWSKAEYMPVVYKEKEKVK